MDMPDTMMTTRASCSASAGFGAKARLNVGLVAYNWEADTSLALWNLVTYARRTPAIADRVTFVEHCAATPKSLMDEEAQLFFLLKWQETHQFDVIGFSCYIWNIKFVLRAAKAMKELWPETVIIFGGQQIRGSYIPFVFDRERCADICVGNEAEVTFRDMLLNFLDGTPKLSAVGGISYMKVAGDADRFHIFDGFGRVPADRLYHETADATLIEDINDIPSPYLGAIDLPMGGAFLYEASRGCPYRCSFCIWGESKGVREYEMERVEAELHNILAHHPSHIMFCDGTFNMRKDRAARILEILVEHLRDGRVQPFSLLLELKLEIIDDNLARVMDELVQLNPLVTFEFGLQSASQEAAKLMRRPFAEDRFRKAWNRLSDQLKSSAIIDCIYGLPGDGIEQFMQTVDFCYSLSPHRIQAFRLSILPGSEFERQAEEHEIRYMREPNHMVYETKWLNLDQMAWVETFGFAVADLYHFHGTTIKCLLTMKDQLGLTGFSGLIKSFVDWAGRERILGSIYAGNRPEGRWRAIDLSKLFERYVVNHLLADAGMADPAIVERLHDLFRYEVTMGRVAVGGIAESPLPALSAGGGAADLAIRVELMHSRFNIPAFLIAARGQSDIEIMDMDIADSHVAFTQKAGHQGVLVPISYRISGRMASLIEAARRDTAAGAGLAPILSKLVKIGIVAEAGSA
jgi:radical SAM superfamily enzyme YgiQ (UPF0313 family)